MHITLCVVTELFLKVYFFFRAQSFIFINPLQCQRFSVFDSIWKCRKEPGRGGRGHTPSPRGKEKLFNIFIFVGPSWHHELLVARQFSGDVLYNIYPSLSEDPEKRAE